MRIAAERFLDLQRQPIMPRRMSVVLVASQTGTPAGTGAKEGDPYQFQLPATEYEMVLDPSLNQRLPQGDSGIEPPFWSNATVWYHELDVPGRGSVFRVVTVESDLSRYVVIRSTASELEAAQFTSLILDCEIHPNALPQRIH